MMDSLSLRMSAAVLFSGRCKWLGVALCVALSWAAASPPALAQGPAFGREVLPAPPQPGAIELRPQTSSPDAEVWHMADGHVAVRNVTRPALIPVLPDGPRSGAAVIVAPGGAFRGLAMETEGFAVARWLARQGIVAFVLKYRPLPTPASQADFIEFIAAGIRGDRPDARPPADTPDDAFADGLAALRLVRERAASFGVDPQRVGMMGFSAGGFLARSLIERGESHRPDFGVLIYPRMTTLAVPAPSAAGTTVPPLFVLIAHDDFLLRGLQGFPLVDSVRAAGGSIEFHLLPGGGHGFGLGRAGTPSADWPLLLQRWLRLQGLSVIGRSGGAP